MRGKNRILVGRRGAKSKLKKPREGLLKKGRRKKVAGGFFTRTLMQEEETTKFAERRTKELVSEREKNRETREGQAMFQESSGRRRKPSRLYNTNRIDIAKRLCDT